MNHRTATRRRRVRRGFNLVELMIALSITATLLTATFVAIDASFDAYQRTTEQASTHTVGRLILHRVLTLIRSGTEFGPFPLSPLDSLVESNFIEFVTPTGEVMTIEWDPDEEALVIDIDGTENLLLGGVIAQLDPDTGEQVAPFVLEYEKGRTLWRATVDLTIVPDDDMEVEIDGDAQQVIRLVGSAMPRNLAYQQ